MNPVLVAVVFALLLLHVSGQQEKDALGGATDIRMKDLRTQQRVEFDENIDGSGHFDESYKDWLGDNESDPFDAAGEDSQGVSVKEEKEESDVADVENDDMDDAVEESGSGADVYVPPLLESENTTPSDIFFVNPTFTAAQPVASGSHEEGVDGNAYSHRQMVFVVILASTVSVIVVLIAAAVALVCLWNCRQRRIPTPDHVRRQEWERGYRRIIDSSGICDV